ncbi:gamma subclass chorismate mutase AroQ [Curtobacterium flaccumfaciens pv. oortii]|uniref:gamma subclass chorismate mutase AroQ n=1 Tax=Curtobacterium flaccumfaciens TaxID=2035 RepID=UPI00265B05A7|nr:gamma subclass chorismate mutase AroQ [Curtobacterium flaccumfaciens]MCS5524734.1 gamma subclass chorismate mutase AroQ [Curtobacterium flaccumfaciens pv. oortii]
MRDETIGADPKLLSALGALIVQRLTLAEPVAEAKWVAGRPISDPSREQTVIDGEVELAKDQRIDPALVARVFRAQIEASKAVQHRLFAQWAQDPSSAPTSAPDLTAIRTELDAIDAALVMAIGAVTTVLGSPKEGSAAALERGRASAGLDSLHGEPAHTDWLGFAVS